MLQGVPGSGFENRELVDAFQQAIKFGDFRGRELLFGMSGQQRVHASLRRWRQEAVRQRFQFTRAQANKHFGVMVHGELSKGQL
jgi:hypothetical protein